MSGKNKHKNQQTSPADHNTAQKENANRHVYIEPPVQIDIVQDLKKQHETARAEDAASQRKQLFWTKIAAGLIFAYTLISAWQLKVAHDTYIAANRPYVGVNAISTFFFSQNALGESIITKEPRQTTAGMEYRIEVKNFGPIPGNHFRSDQKVLLGGKELVGTKVPDQPSVIFPSESVYLNGDLRDESYHGIMDRTKVLVIEITSEYDGPSGHYEYCEKKQFEPGRATFLNLGMCEQ
jgi:hypothetical protein